ncbi:MAG: hypothetical protein LBO73_03965 [Holosporaceae bacterium]|nr:hypothetical protein [Holosporaceae bacterium]
MRYFIFLLLSITGTTGAMYCGTDVILADFERGQYEPAVFKAMRMIEENGDDISKNACKFFLKEFYPIMLQEDESLAKFQGAYDLLTEGFLPERDYPDDIGLLRKLCNLAQGRYAATENIHWCTVHEAISFGILGDNRPAALRPEPAADPEAELRGEKSSDDYEDNEYSDTPVEDNPFIYIIGKFTEKNYREALLETAQFGKNSDKKKVRNACRTFLDRFFHSLPYYSATEDPNLESLTELAYDLLSEFDTDSEYNERDLAPLLEGAMQKTPVKELCWNHLLCSILYGYNEREDEWKKENEEKKKREMEKKNSDSDYSDYSDSSHLTLDGGHGSSDDFSF